MAINVKDPVCGMVIEKPNAAAETTYEGTTYYFCSQDCKDAFDRDPKKHIDKTKQQPGRE